MAEWLSYLIDHIFLPPKLPQKDDWHHEKDLVLLAQCEAALSAYQVHLQDGHERWEMCTSMVRNMIEVRDNSRDMSPKRIGEKLLKMSIKGMPNSFEAFPRANSLT